MLRLSEMESGSLCVSVAISVFVGVGGNDAVSVIVRDSVCVFSDFDRVGGGDIVGVLPVAVIDVVMVPDSVAS